MWSSNLGVDCKSIGPGGARSARSCIHQIDLSNHSSLHDRTPRRAQRPLESSVPRSRPSLTMDPINCSVSAAPSDKASYETWMTGLTFRVMSRSKRDRKLELDKGHHYARAKAPCSVTFCLQGDRVCFF